MKNNSILKAIGLTLSALFYAILEVIIYVLRNALKWAFVACVCAVSVIVFVLMLPFSLYKCLARSVRHRSVAAGAQMFKWICIDYFQHLKL